MEMPSKEKIERVLGTMDEDQLEIFMVVFLLYKKSEEISAHALEQTRRMFSLLSEGGEGNEHDLREGWKEADHDWDRDEQGAPYGYNGEGDDGQPGARREPEGDAGETVEHEPEHRSE